jgi:hypothetical protein
MSLERLSSGTRGSQQRRASEPLDVDPPTKDTPKIAQSPTPKTPFRSRTGSNIIEIISFSYMNEFLKEAETRDIKFSEYPKLESTEDIRGLSGKLAREWYSKPAATASESKLWAILVQCVT